MYLKVKDGYVKWDIPGVYKGSISSGRVTVRIVSCKGKIYHDGFCYGNPWTLKIDQGDEKYGKEKHSSYILDKKRQLKSLWRRASK